MLDERENIMTATTWQDNHRRYRKHKLITKELGDTIPAIGANEHVDDYDDVLAPAKLFSPYTGWRRYITEWDAETGLCFGLVEGFETELGYFDLTELAEATVLGNVSAAERDLYWVPKTIGEIRRQSRFTGRARVLPHTGQVAEIVSTCSRSRCHPGWCDRPDKARKSQS